jgi:uncharacterized protein with HEPN domain
LRRSGNIWKARPERWVASDSKTVDAVVRNLEVIGEAVKLLPEEIRWKQPDVEWQKIAGLRDILIHRYFGIDLEIIQDIVENKLPLLNEKVRRLLDE